MMYEEHLRAADAGAWSLDTDIRWADIDREVALSELRAGMAGIAQHRYDLPGPLKLTYPRQRVAV